KRFASPCVGGGARTATGRATGQQRSETTNRFETAPREGIQSLFECPRVDTPIYRLRMSVRQDRSGLPAPSRTTQDQGRWTRSEPDDRGWPATSRADPVSARSAARLSARTSLDAQSLPRSSF